MPLPPTTVQRTLKHVRSVQLSGYQRSDGCWDIEARLTDVKDHDYPLSSGLRKRGEPVHDMWLRVTIDHKMTILDAVASTDAMPYVGYCDRITPSYAQLVGLNLFHGFRTAVKTLFRGARGCSHLSELAMFLPTAALQTFASDVPDSGEGGQKPYQLDRCHALESHSDAVRRFYPRWYHGQKPG